MKTSRLLIIIIALQCVLLLSIWTSNGAVSKAYGELPNDYNQHVQMVESLKSIDAKMDKLIGVLSDGHLQVTVAPSDDNKAAGAK